jgi:hypothetical protein
LPGWITKTDAEGGFTFPLYKNPGEDGVIRAYYSFFVFPPENVETDDPRYKISTTPISYDIFFEWNYMHDFRNWSEIYFNKELILRSLFATANSATPFLAIATEAQRQRLYTLADECAKHKEQIQKGKEERARLEEQLKQYAQLPDAIGKTWQERALKMQREFEKEFKAARGESSGWDEATRKLYQDKMYEIPKQAKALWEEDLRKFNEDKKKQEILLKKSEEALAKLQSRNPEEELVKAWQDIHYDIVVDMPLRNEQTNYKQMPVPAVYEINGTVSGEEMTPKTRTGYCTEVHLIKRGLDELQTREPVLALSVDTQSRSVSGDLNKAKSHKPPYRFKFTEKIPEHLVINRYIKFYSENMGIPVANRGIPVGAGPIFFDMSAYGVRKELVDNALNALWGHFALPKEIQVEGAPSKPVKIKDEKRFKELVDESKKIAQEMNALGLKYGDLMRANPGDPKYAQQYQQELNKLTERYKAIQKEIQKLTE